MAAENNRTQVVRLLGNMMNAHADVVRKSTEELTSLYTDPESTVELCTVLGNASKLPAMRKCAGHILKSRLAQPGVWQKMLPGIQQNAQEALLAALKSLACDDDDENLQLAIVRNVAIVMGLELEAKSESSDWNASVFEYVEQLCTAAEKPAQLLGAIFFKLLVKTAPKMFEHYLVRAQSIFMRSLNLAEAQAELATPATEQLLAGWCLAIPLFRKRPDEQNSLSATLPLILRLTHAFAYQPNPKRCSRGFDVLSKLHKHVPELVWPHLQLLLDELCRLASDTELGDEIRIQAIVALRNCVRLKRRQIIRLKLMDKLLMTLYGLMAVKPALDANGEELYLGDNQETNTPLSEATQTVLFVAAQSDTNRVAERALRLMQPQLEQHQSAVQRVAGHLFLALMAKGFTDLLADNPLRSFVDAVERGVYDVELLVRRAAHFALAVMAENLQPEITVLAPKVLPLFSEFFDQLTPEQRLSPNELESHTRMFCTLEIYAESLKREALQPHLGDLMQRLLATVQPNSNSVSLRQLSLSAIASLSKMSGELFLPHFDAVIAVALPLVKHTPDEDQLLLRTNAIQVINTLSDVSAEKFAACAPQLLECFLEMVQQVSGAQVFTYELLAVLARHIPTQISAHMSLIMNGIFAAIKEGAAGDKDTDTDDDTDDDNDDDNNDDTDDDNGEVKDEDGNETETETEAEVEAEAEAAADASACTEDDSIGDGHGDQTEHDAATRSESSSESVSSPAGHDEAIMCLKSLAVHLPDAVTPYLPEAVRRVAACTESRNELGKRAAYEALTEFAVLRQRNGDATEARLQCRELLPELVEFVESSKETANVIAAMNCITKFLLLLKADALTGDGFADLVFNMVRRTLRRKLSCQFNIGHDMKMEQLQQWSQALHAETQVMEAVGQLLPAFGQAMRKRQFASYFHKISERFLKSLRQCQPNGHVTPHLFFLYGLVYRCMEPLGVVSERYYDVLCYSVVDCMLDTQPHVRQFACELEHWLLNQTQHNDNSLVIIKATSRVFIDALAAHAARPLPVEEREQASGIVARMLLAGPPDCLPTASVLPALCANLPLQQHFAAYAHLLPAVRQLQQQQPALLQPHLGQLLQVLHLALQQPQRQLPGEDTHQVAIELHSLLEAQQQELHDEVS